MELKEDKKNRNFESKLHKSNMYDEKWILFWFWHTDIFPLDSTTEIYDIYLSSLDSN